VAAEWTIYQGKEWTLPDVTFAYPDLVIRESYVIAPVRLVVESVSTGQRHNKLFQKCFDTYHAWRIPYCWVIDPDEGSAYEVDRDWDGLVRPVRTLTAGPEIRLELSTILAELQGELHPF
jgi:Uma2 family endonuclease